MASALGWWPMIVSAAVDCGELASARAQIERLRGAAADRALDLHSRLAALEAQLTLAHGDLDGAVDGFTHACAVPTRSCTGFRPTWPRPAFPRSGTAARRRPS